MASPGLVGGVDRTVRTPDTEGVVLQSFTEDGSVRNVAGILNLSKSTVQRILCTLIGIL
jgi:hypothetical protein